MSNDPLAPGNWREYYRRTGQRPPRPTLLFALAKFDQPGIAVDLGCGGGRDAVELLRQGWTVHGVDSAADAGSVTTSRADFPDTGSFDFINQPFQDADWPENALTNSSFALPFCTTPDFARVWHNIETRIAAGGRFAGHLFGPNDSWFGRDGITFHTKDEVEALFAGWEFELFDEEEDDSITPRGNAKHWHIWHLVAVKR